MTALAARLVGVHVTFPGGVHALSDIHAQIAPCTITGLVGESGSGKTTLCRVVAGLQHPTAGHVEVFGQPIAGLRGDARRRFHRAVQMLLQDAPGSLSPRMTARALLYEPVAIHRLKYAEVGPQLALLLSRLGLDPALLDRYPHQLSAGQARRIAVARALMLEPQLLIADEPTAGLDLSVQGELLNLLKDMHATLGLAMLVCSHNLSIIGRIATNTLVIYLGQVVEQGPTATLFTAPAHPYTAALISAHVVIDPASRRTRIVLHGEMPSVITPPAGCRFHTRCPQVQPRCKSEEPSLRSWGDRAVRCHFPLRP